MRANALWYEDRPLYPRGRFPADDFRRHGFYPGGAGGMTRQRYAQYNQNWRHFRDQLRDMEARGYVNPRRNVEAAYRRRARPGWLARRQNFARVYRRAHQAADAGDARWFEDNPGVPNVLQEWLDEPAIAEEPDINEFGKRLRDGDNEDV